MHITTKVVSSNRVHGEVYSIQHQVIKFVRDLWHFCDLTYRKSTKSRLFNFISQYTIYIGIETYTYK
jgi:hypothetical protein